MAAAGGIQVFEPANANPTTARSLAAIDRKPVSFETLSQLDQFKRANVRCQPDFEQLADPMGKSVLFCFVFWSVGPRRCSSVGPRKVTSILPSLSTEPGPHIRLSIGNERGDRREAWHRWRRCAASEAPRRRICLGRRTAGLGGLATSRKMPNPRQCILLKGNSLGGFKNHIKPPFCGPPSWNTLASSHYYRDCSSSFMVLRSAIGSIGRPKRVRGTAANGSCTREDPLDEANEDRLEKLAACRGHQGSGGKLPPPQKSTAA